MTTAASGFDQAVLRISTAYTSRGQVSTITQWDDQDPGAVSPTDLDGVEYIYDDWGNIATFRQDRDSAVTALGNHYQVGYNHAKATGGRNTVRRTDMTLPGSGTASYEYLSTGSSLDGDASRVSRVSLGVNVVRSYKYTGAAMVVGITYGEPSVKRELHGSTMGSYPDLDRFNRTTTSRWTKTHAGGSVDFYEVDLSYDENSGITWAEDKVHGGFDARYVMDQLNRLLRAEEGTRSGGSIASRTRDELWGLSQTGNWLTRQLDLDGNGGFTGTGELDEIGTFNIVNELTARDIDNDATNDYTLTYDANGNLTDDGKDFTYEYDAFNRLRRVKDRASTSLVAEYRYNGLGFRIGWHYDVDGDGTVESDADHDPWYYLAYTPDWRHIATFRHTDTDPKERFLPGNAGLGGITENSQRMNASICF